MTPTQWLWFVIIVLNAFSIGMRVVLMGRDGAGKIDYVFLTGGAAIIGWGTWTLWDLA